MSFFLDAGLVEETTAKHSPFSNCWIVNVKLPEGLLTYIVQGSERILKSFVLPVFKF